MMKQCVFLFLFSVGAHGIRLQPSRQSLQQGVEPEIHSVMDDINAAKGAIWTTSGQVINTCVLPWGETGPLPWGETPVDQFFYGANWYSNDLLLPPTEEIHYSLIEKPALGFKVKTSRDTASGGTNNNMMQVPACDEYMSNLRDETQSPIYDPDPDNAWYLENAKIHAGLPNAFTIGQHFGMPCDTTKYSKQTDVRNMISDWKHHNYGGSFRIPSWLYLCAGMTANGDPHVVNMLGETFDIVSQGEVELVRYPKGADDSSSKLIITASIDKLGQGCHDTYMKKITVSGAWLKESISFKDNEDNGNILVSQGSDARLAPMEMNKINGSDAVKLDSKQIHFLNPKRASLTVAGVTQVVVYTSGRPHKGVGTYLNLDLQGFTNLEGKVGGLLGQDSHKKELDLAKDLCRKTSVAKSRAFHQKGNDVPLHEDNRVFHVEIH